MYAFDLNNYSHYSKDKQIALAKDYKSGDRTAGDKLITSHLKLVVSEAANFTHRGLEFDDLVQEGILGLYKALDHFDYNKGTKFTTYAVWWIRQAIRRAVHNKGRTIRIPVHTHNQLGNYKKIVEKLTNELGRKPKDKEIAEKMGLKLSKVLRLKKLRKSIGSLNVKYGEDADTELGDLIEDNDSIIPENIALKDDLYEQLNKVLSILSDREREIILLRFGMFDGTERTLEDIGQVFGLTRERIRQLESRALRKLSNSKKTDDLRQYF